MTDVFESNSQEDFVDGVKRDLLFQGYSEEDAEAIIADALKRVEEQNKAKEYAPLKEGVNDKKMAAYWAALRQQNLQNFGITESVSPSKSAIETFKANMKAKNSASLLRNNAKAAEWFRNQKQKNT